jgi:hypothetical protein
VCQRQTPFSTKQQKELKQLTKIAKKSILEKNRVSGNQGKNKQ